jgi:hypothetical protein
LASSGEESFIDRVQRLATCCLELELGGCFDEMVWLTLVFATGLGGGCHGDFEFFFGDGGGARGGATYHFPPYLFPLSLFLKLFPAISFPISRHNVSLPATIITSRHFAERKNSKI